MNIKLVSLKNLECCPENSFPKVLQSSCIFLEGKGPFLCHSNFVRLVLTGTQEIQLSAPLLSPRAHETMPETMPILQISTRASNRNCGIETSVRPNPTLFCFSNFGKANSIWPSQSILAKPNNFGKTN